MNNGFRLPDDAKKKLTKYELEELYNMQRVIVNNATEKEVTAKRFDKNAGISITITAPGHQLTLNLGPDFNNEVIVIDTLPREYIAGIIQKMQANGYDKARRGFSITDQTVIDIVGTNFLSYSKFLAVKEMLSSMAFDADYGYAVTSHKSQGSTYTHTFVDENDISSVTMNSMKNKSSSLYTAVSRTKEKLFIYNPMNPVQTVTSQENNYLQAASNTLMNGMAGPWIINGSPVIER